MNFSIKKDFWNRLMRIIAKEETNVSSFLLGIDIYNI